MRYTICNLVDEVIARATSWKAALYMFQQDLRAVYIKDEKTGNVYDDPHWTSNQTLEDEYTYFDD